MMYDVNEHILKALQLSKKLKELADGSVSSCEDDGCLLLNGLVRECGYRIQEAAEKEQQVHVEQGLWSGNIPDAP